MNSLAKKWHSEPQSSHSDFQTNPQTTQMTTRPSGDFELVCVIVNVQPQSKLIFRLLIMILPWSINVFLTLDQKVLQFLFRQDAFPACRLPADNKPGWFVALSCSTSHNKKSPDLSPSAFLQHCWGTRRCCSLPEGQAMLWMDYQSRNTLRYVFKYLRAGGNTSVRIPMAQSRSKPRVPCRAPAGLSSLQTLPGSLRHWCDWTMAFSPPGGAEKVERTPQVPPGIVLE